MGKGYRGTTLLLHYCYNDTVATLLNSCYLTFILGIEISSNLEILYISTITRSLMLKFLFVNRTE